MASEIAHFPAARDLDGFAFAAQPSLDPRQIRELATCRWVAHGEALLLLGPPGSARRIGRARSAAAIRRRPPLTIKSPYESAQDDSKPFLITHYPQLSRYGTKQEHAAVSAGLNDGAQQGAISKGAQRGPVCCSLS